MLRPGPVACLLGLLAGPALASPPVYQLELGEPSRRARQVDVVLDGIVDTRRDEVITPEAMAKRLASTRVLFIGEDHTNMDFHRVQFQAIRALHAAGREVLLGLEMFPYSAQQHLDDWSAGRLSETEFVERSGWYATWGYRWEYYREIMAFARDQQLGVFGVNAPREIIKRIRQSGFEAVSAEDRAHLPPVIDTDSEEHRQLFRAYFGDDDAPHGDLSEAQWEGMFRAQCTWDAVMGWNAVRALEAHGGPDAIMVVLIGSGHVAYGLGSARQIAAHLEGAVGTLLPVPAANAHSGETARVQASYAEFVWGVPVAEPPLYPMLGLSLAGPPARAANEVIQLDAGGPAEQAGVRRGDLLLAIGGQAIESSAELRRQMAGYYWGDATQLEVKRGDEAIRLEVVFRRPAPGG